MSARRVARDQPDFFLAETEADPIGDDYAPPVYYPDPVRIRAEIHRILGEARAAESLPWNARTTRLYRLIVPQMSRSLPEEEAERLRLEFEAEMARLEGSDAPDAEAPTDP